MLWNSLPVAIRNPSRLEERRNRADIVEVFKMFCRNSTVPFETFFQLDSNNRTRGHTAKIKKNRCRTDLRKHFLSRVSILLLTRDIDIPILSVSLSVRDTLVLYENGSDYRHSFFTIR